MNAKILVYLAVGFAVLVAMDSINLNGIFKKNKIFQARMLFFMIFMSLTYLVTNFLWDLFTTIISH
jgi:uncharacterized membrane protein YwzB